jgi:phosphoenolpyruvate carboxykinase (ATP)
MNLNGLKNPSADLSTIGISGYNEIFWNLTPEELIEHTIRLNQGILTDSGALSINTGEFTGRSPKDKFCVSDDKTESTVDWGGFNTRFGSDQFGKLYDKVTNHLIGKNLYVRDLYACADEKYRLKVRVVNEFPWSNLFANNMFIRPSKEELSTFEPDWVIINAPSFHADPAVDGTRQHNFSILDFTRKVLLIGGSGYTGEMKKGIFTVLNYTLPHEKNVLSMHCSANVGVQGDTAVFFGLSGTGKTTLSADPNRPLIGDDEHGWSDEGVFNFEGGCYAKTIDLSEEKEPDIFKAVRHGALLENIGFYEGTRTPDYTDGSITENTRVSYPIHHISNALPKSVAGHPKNIFFLTCDAFGVLPPISKLTPGQAMFLFVSGYTAKVAGTEVGIKEPKTTFSACFGAPFLPLPATTYARMLGEKMESHKVNVWLINTGWSGGGYGEGNRIKLKFTRAMITAALTGALDNAEFQAHDIFGLHMPVSCPDVPSEILNPKNTWKDNELYDIRANDLAGQFVKNFEKFRPTASKEMLEALPKVVEGV